MTAACERAEEIAYSTFIDPDAPSLCTVTYMTPANFRVDPDDVPFVSRSENFCGWGKGYFTTQFLSQRQCREGAALSEYKVKRIRRTHIIHNSGDCQTSETYFVGDTYSPWPEDIPEIKLEQQARWTELVSESIYRHATVSYSPASSRSAAGWISEARKFGFPIVAIFLETDRADVFLDERNSPWGEQTCAVLSHRLDIWHPGQMQWTC